MSETSSNSSGCGCGLVGSALAAALSWTTFHSIGWAIVGCAFSWFYVIYYCVRYGAQHLWSLF